MLQAKIPHQVKPADHLIAGVPVAFAALARAMNFMGASSAGLQIFSVMTAL